MKAVFAKLIVLAVLVALVAYHLRNQVQSRKDLTLLCHSSEGRLGGVQECLRGGAAVNGTDQNGWTPLMWAAEDGHGHVVKLLLEKGANPNAASKNGGMLATAISPCEALENRPWFSLDDLDRPGITMPREREFTPLMVAAIGGYEPIIELLIAKGADTSRRNSNGETAGDLAIATGYFKIVKRLGSTPPF